MEVDRSAGSVYLTAVVPSAYRAKLDALSRRHDRSLSAEVRTALKVYFSVSDAEAEEPRSLVSA